MVSKQHNTSANVRTAGGGEVEREEREQEKKERDKVEVVAS